ncbi:MAG: hypothetical protein H7A50_06895 [Akkermansiaceae bacterium]|nr:hypothetical protein [Akkermansiaceae bacterium]
MRSDSRIAVHRRAQSVALPAEESSKLSWRAPSAGSQENMDGLLDGRRVPHLIDRVEIDGIGPSHSRPLRFGS